MSHNEYSLPFSRFFKDCQLLANNQPTSSRMSENLKKNVQKIIKGMTATGSPASCLSLPRSLPGRVCDAPEFFERMRETWSFDSEAHAYSNEIELDDEPETVEEVESPPPSPYEIAMKKLRFVADCSLKDKEGNLYPATKAHLVLDSKTIFNMIRDTSSDDTTKELVIEAPYSPEAVSLFLDYFYFSSKSESGDRTISEVDNYYYCFDENVELSIELFVIHNFFETTFSNHHHFTVRNAQICEFLCKSRKYGQMFEGTTITKMKEQLLKHVSNGTYKITENDFMYLKDLNDDELMFKLIRQKDPPKDVNFKRWDPTYSTLNKIFP